VDVIGIGIRSATDEAEASSPTLLQPLKVRSKLAILTMFVSGNGY